MAAAQAQTSTPQLEASLRHAFPFSTDIMVGSSQGVIAHVLRRRNSFCSAMHKIGGRFVSHQSFKDLIISSCITKSRISSYYTLVDPNFKCIRICRRMLTCVSSSHNLLQNLVFECSQQCLHNHIIVCSGSEAYQSGSGGCSWNLELKG